MAMAKYTRNIQGVAVDLELVEVDPDAVILDSTNPRLGFSIRQLEAGERTDAACTLLLTTQEDVDELKRSIVLSGGVQEPIYLRANGMVAEGNRRVVAMRLAKEERPDDPRFKMMPAWRIPRGTPEAAVQDLLNEIHLGSVRGWAPYEKALQLRALLAGGLIEEEVAERYRMTAREVRQHIAAADFMDREYFPTIADPTNIEHRAKYSYFLEFEKNTKLQKRLERETDLRMRFARWVRMGKVTTGERVRRLPRILESDEATRLLEVAGFDAADEYLRREYPEEQELYAVLEKARARLAAMTVRELYELKDSADRVAIVSGLRDAAETILSAADRMGRERS
jgi:hypothetical protein